jgi:plasmid stability protein
MASNYLLRNLDADVWRRARDRAKADGRSLKYIILRLVAMYANGDVNP